MLANTIPNVPLEIKEKKEMKFIFNEKYTKKNLIHFFPLIFCCYLFLYILMETSKTFCGEACNLLKGYEHVNSG